MKYLIMIDCDGTLKHSDGTISVRSKKIISNLKENGNLIVLCTARPRYYTSKMALEINSDEYLISSNGTEIYDTRNKKIIWASYLEKRQIEKLYKYACSNNVRIIFVTENTEYATQFIRNDNQILLTDLNFNEVLNNNVKQVMIIGKEKDKITIIKDKIIAENELNIIDSSSTNREEVWFSVVSNTSSKGIALLKLADYLNIDYNNTIAIGNDKNDISMIQIAHIGVAVDNAQREVKEVANVITKSNDEDGVAVFLEDLNKK